MPPRPRRPRRCSTPRPLTRSYPSQIPPPARTPRLLCPETEGTGAEGLEKAPAGPWSPGGAAPSQPAAATPARPTIETALGTRWAVWVGGVALALGGLFLVRYSIEAGIFGPEVRLAMAGVLGIALVAAAEFIRRTGFRMPVEGGRQRLRARHIDGGWRLYAVRHGLCRTWRLRLHRPVGRLRAARRHRHRHHRRLTGAGQALAGVGIVGSYSDPAAGVPRRRRTIGRCSVSSP